MDKQTHKLWTNRHTNYGQTNTYVTDTTKWTVKMARRNLTTYTNKHTNYMDKQTHKLWTNGHTNERALRECILCKIGLAD